MADLNPMPVSAALQAHFDSELSHIRTGETGQATLSVTTTGIGLGAGIRKGHWEATAWGGRNWSSGWLAGGQVGLHW